MILNVGTDTRNYNVIIERGALNNLKEHLSLDRKALIVTDSGVPSEYSSTVAAQCKESVTVTIAQGEKSKNFDNYKMLLEKMLENSFSRSDCVIAVGGGVVGDLAGFVASSYMRGVDFYNIPTTLLSQVDSSIGGKVAIDLAGVKNIVGAFYQPHAVIIDSNVLKTLEHRQLIAGFAETIKMAATSNKELFELIENSTDFDSDIDTFITESLKIKKNVVENDPTEKGLRKVLNFGHTIGHAIESCQLGRLLHGECVALGMLYMAEEKPRERILKVLEKYSLPTKVDISPEKLISFIKHDKKASSDSVSAVYLNSIGDFEFKKIDFDSLNTYLTK